jgi:chromosome segregation ATPase
VDALQQELGNARSRYDEMWIRLQHVDAGHEELGAKSRKAIDSLTSELRGLQVQHNTDFAQLGSSIEQIKRTLAGLDALRALQADSSIKIDAQARRLEAAEKKSAELPGRLDSFENSLKAIDDRLDDQTNARKSDHDALARLQRELVALSGLSTAMHDRLGVFGNRSDQAIAGIESLDSKYGQFATALLDLKIGLVAVSTDEKKMRSEQFSARLGR